eukprot:symbB.v1.2.016693.t2/scaffold1262.1/size136238/2
MDRKPKEVVRARRGCEEPPEPPQIPRLPKPQSAHRQTRKEEEQALHQPALPRKVRPPQDFSSMARPALKPLVESDEGSASPPLLDPPSVVAASRLMQEAYTSDTELGETSDDDDEIHRWSPPSSISSSEATDFLSSAWRAASDVVTWLKPKALERFWGKVHCDQMLPHVCCSPPLQPPEEARREHRLVFFAECPFSSGCVQQKVLHNMQHQVQAAVEKITQQVLTNSASDARNRSSTFFREALGPYLPVINEDEVALEAIRNKALEQQEEAASEAWRLQTSAESADSYLHTLPQMPQVAAHELHQMVDKDLKEVKTATVQAKSAFNAMREAEAEANETLNLANATEEEAKLILANALDQAKEIKELEERAHAQQAQGKKSMLQLRK